MNDSQPFDLVPRPQNAPRVAPPGGGTPPTVYIETYGCQMNTYDSQVILGRLAAAGFLAVTDHLAADLVLVNTCSVREHAEHRVISRLGELRHLRRQAGHAPAVLGICGCMAERMREELARQKHPVDLVVGVDRYDELPRLAWERLAARDDLAAATPAGARGPAIAVGHDASVHYVAPPELYPTNSSHLVTIHKGCDHRCTYCIVPSTRGPQSEKPPAVILEEIAGVVAAGGEEVTLLGQNVTAYRWRGELDFTQLLDQILEHTAIKRIRFLTGHPCDMRPQLIDLIAGERRVCPWLHVPAQSGSDRVLARMARQYTSAQYLQMIERARAAIADVTFSSDFIVGFPGETEADFVATLDLVRTVGFDTIFAFKYSPRPGAPSACLPDDVPQEVKERRLAELHAVQADTWQAIAAAQVGAVWTAVVEGPARRPEGHWRLRTASNRKVIAPLIDPAAGQTVSVRVVGWRNTSFLGTPA